MRKPRRVKRTLSYEILMKSGWKRVIALQYHDKTLVKLSFVVVRKFFLFEPEIENINLFGLRTVQYESISYVFNPCTIKKFKENFLIYEMKQPKTCKE